MPVLNFNIERRSEEPLARANMNTLRPSPERRGCEDPHALSLHHAIARYVLAFEIGVDRHLRASPSSDRRNEVDRDHAALLYDEIDRFERNR